MKLTPRFLDGAVLAVNALPGVFAVVDAPRCELERAWIFDSTHDWYGRVSGTGTYARDRRIFSPLWKNRTLITGTEDVLRELVHFVAERHPHSPILLYSSFLTLLVNADLQGAAASLASQIENPIICVQRESLEDDWVDGIRRTQEAVFSFLASEQGQMQPHVAGFCTFRTEGDETGNLLEIERLWQAADFPRTLWPFSGKPFDLSPISVSSPRIAFPLGCPPDGASRPGGTVGVDLPIGVEQTCDFLRKLGEFFDRSNQVERVIERERRVLRERLAPLVANNLAGKAAVVVADPWSARGLAAALRETGMDIPLVAALRRAD